MPSRGVAAREGAGGFDHDVDTLGPSDLGGIGLVGERDRSAVELEMAIVHRQLGIETSMHRIARQAASQRSGGHQVIDGDQLEPVTPVGDAS